MSHTNTLCSFCRYYNSILSYFMIYHRIVYSSNMTTSTSGEGTAYLFRTHEFTPGFCLLRFAQSLVFYVKIVFALFFFVLCIPYCQFFCIVHLWLPLRYSLALNLGHFNIYAPITYFNSTYCVFISFAMDINVQNMYLYIITY
jgi:hypothetical protein